MSLFDVPEEDRGIIWLATIVAIVILGCVLFETMSDIQEKAEAFKNGYEQVYDTAAHETLWKKKDQQ